MTDINSHLKNIFNATQIAYSPITKREATGDKSLTLSKSESAVIFSLYDKEKFPRGGKEKSDTKVILFDYQNKNEHIIDIAIKYPKLNKNELRLYFRRYKDHIDFYPSEGDLFFIFNRKDSEFSYIGSISRGEWDKLSLGYSNTIIEDEDDLFYQQAIEAPPVSERQEITTTGFKRNIYIAQKAIELASHSCEVDSSHTTFISQRTKQSYVEAHHLIPISKSEDFSVSLDQISNIVSLCPNCHMAIHRATYEERAILVDLLYQKRKKRLEADHIIINLDQLLSYYA